MPFALHLAAGGHQVSVYDRDDSVVPRASEHAGITPCDGVAAVVAASDVVFTCLPHPDAVAAVYAEVHKPGLVCCDNSTVGPALARSLHEQLRTRGVGYVECPMLGSGTQARDGKLFLLLSGVAQDIDHVLPMALLAARGHRVVGGPGQASLFKTVQNGLGHVQAVAIGEALALVAKAGGDLDQFIEAVATGQGMAASPLFGAKAPMMRHDPVPNQGSLYIAAKDAALAAALCDELGMELPLFQRAPQIYAAAMEMGLGHQDMAALARVVENETGVKLSKPEK